MIRSLGILIAVAALVFGWVFRDNHYRLQGIAMPSDQAVLHHRDSAYTSMTWVGSDSENFLQLRFFDKVEGGLCLRPTWGDLQTLAAKDSRLAHLVPAPGSVPPGANPDPRWRGALPDPGTLPNSAYVRFFPVGLLLNEALMAPAGGDLHRIAPRILVIGLGSSVGVLGLAHHVPQASITVVDIDREVEAAVREHIPIARWLETQKTADGSPRLRLIAQDARQFIRFDVQRDGKLYDLIILDAYTAGSTIPSHLMTKEFFAECKNALTPSGLVLGNIIGSHTGPKHLVVGGTLRSLRAAGLTSAHSIPVFQDPAETPAAFNPASARNNIIIASQAAIDPRRNKVGWDRLTTFVPFPELPSGTAITTQLIPQDADGRFVGGGIPLAVAETAVPGIAGLGRALTPTGPAFAEFRVIDDKAVIAKVRAAGLAWAAQEGLAPPLGWNDPSLHSLLLRRTDWLKASREVWRVSIQAGRDAAKHGAEALVGPLEGPDRDDRNPTWIIGDAPLFTDQMPNADIVNL